MDDVRPPNKVTDYSSSSDDSDTTDEDDDEEVDQEAGEESTSGPEDSKAVYVPHFTHFVLTLQHGPAVHQFRVMDKVRFLLNGAACWFT